MCNLTSSLISIAMIAPGINVMINCAVLLVSGLRMQGSSMKPSQHELLEDVRRRISQLEEAIRHINITKTNLKQNSMEVSVCSISNKWYTDHHRWRCDTSQAVTSCLVDQVMCNEQNGTNLMSFLIHSAYKQQI